MNVTKFSAAEVEIENNREWSDFDIMARHFDPPTDLSNDYRTCEGEYGDCNNGKRFRTFNILEATISSTLDMPWVLSKFGDRGDHRFEKFEINNFKVLNDSG